jgi:predicted transcriptional regulator
MQPIQNIGNYPPALQAELMHISETQNISLETIVFQALSEYVERKNTRKAMFDRDVAESKARFEKTGMHIKNSELRDWIDRKKAGENLEFPKCHI